MKKSKLFFIVCPILVLILVSVVSFSKSSKNNSSPESGWITLFNGKDLSGWVQIEGTAKYTVENHEIIGQTVPNNPNGILCTKNKYSNFILELEVKIDTALNSGIQIRSHTNKKGEVYGYQVEIDPSARAWSGGIYDSRRRGWLADLKNKPSAQKAFRNGEWNQYRVIAVDDTIKTWVNSIPIATLVDSLDSSGFIGLQVHQSSSGEALKVQFRNIRIKVLK
jgi:hypothetical protein